MAELEKTEEDQIHPGRLKIFFGYGPGGGKTDTMLRAAHGAAERGIDVVAGRIEAHGRAETIRLCTGLESLPDSGRAGCDLDLDAAIARKPQLLLVDELAHINGPDCRHARRYQDITELLKAGIDVWTTVNVQNIESLNDVVTTITGVSTGERIPDSVFDNADQVELVDLKPEKLLERLRSAALTSEGLKELPTLENLTALRELALRRGADRINLETVRQKTGGDYKGEEHILVCLSPSPSNGKIIRTAARMAAAFGGSLTALFVETPEFASLPEEDLVRLRDNIHLAQQLEAKIETVCGEDIPYQIAEFARLSEVTKIVIGRSTAARRRPFHKATLSDLLITLTPNLEVHVIPDMDRASPVYRARKASRPFDFRLCYQDVLKTLGILTGASLIGMIFHCLRFAESNIIMVYVLGVLLIAIFTSHRLYSFISSVVSVLVFNFLFTDPKFSLQAYDQGYFATFIIMFLVAFLTGSLAIKLKSNARQSSRSAFRTKILFDANQMLQQAGDRDEIVTAVASQLTRLLDKDIVVYLAEEKRLGEARLFPAEEGTQPDRSCLRDSEREVAEWVFKNNKHAGATTLTFSGARCLYLALRVSDRVYGVVGITMAGTPVDAFETSILLSILGECALALENEHNAREKEQAAILAKNEQLRANLLRTISHDLRTPLTSISGNASNLLSNGAAFDQETKQQLYSDIYQDSMWLINLVENLLSVTRLDEGRLKLRLTEELVDDVVAEALRHVDRKCTERTIEVRHEDEFLLARMDAKLIVQVMINLVDNAIKYTPAGAHIEILTRQVGKMAEITVADDGPGIPEKIRGHIFEMFYSGANQIADSRRSLGLGLSLCRSIVTAHGGTISVSNRSPHGAAFTFTLPIGEVTLHE